MQTSIFLAKLLGPIFVVVGIALLLRREMFRDLLEDFLDSPVIMYLGGFLGLLGGLALVLAHNVWALDWRVIITLIGWLSILRALVTIFAPEWIVSIGSKLLDHRMTFLGAALADLVIGFVLSYFGYLAAA